MTTAKFAPFEGGLDTETPAIAKRPGSCIDALNYEIPAARGYRRINGYERFDGRPSPTEAVYYTLDFTAGYQQPSVGNVFEGMTSGALGRILVQPTAVTGSWALSTATGTLVLRIISGTFQDGENIKQQGGGTVRCVADGTATLRGATTDANDDAWMALAVADARSLIAAVTGSGAIRGVWMYDGDVYAFRDNAGATACEMWVSSTSGWTQVALGYTLNFVNGTSAISAGETVTGGTSAATGTVGRVILTSGTWGGGTAAGRLILTAKTGNFGAAETITSAGGSATTSGTQTANTLQPGGRFEFANHNFYASAGSVRMYGCDGVSKAFEFDGSVFVPIITGMTVDKPTFINVHHEQLFLQFAGGSVQSSDIGEPINWTLALGTTEIGVGDEGTGMMTLADGSMLITTRNKAFILYGKSQADFELRELSTEAGAYPYTMQKLLRVYGVDDYGVRSLDATADFGNFQYGTESELIQRVINEKKSLAVASYVRRSANQYRVFFSDNTGLSMSVAGSKVIGFMPLDYGRVVRCACSAEVSGTERVFFGSDSGWVFEDCKGASFDGSAMEYAIRLAFNHLGSPQVRKRFKRAFFELEADRSLALSGSFELSYSDLATPASGSSSIAVSGGGGYWDIDNWDEIYWDDQAVSLARLRLSGRGTNISLMLYGNSATENPHTLHGVTIHYDMGRGER